MGEEAKMKVVISASREFRDRSDHGRSAELDGSAMGEAPGARREKMAGKQQRGRTEEGMEEHSTWRRQSVGID